MRKKLIYWIVKKLWDYDEFQESIVEKIKEYPIEWSWKYLNKVVSEVNGYTVLYNSNQMCPWVFTSEEEVRKQVSDWDQIINDYKAKQNPVETPKKKRVYKRKKKEVKE